MQYQVPDGFDRMHENISYGQITEIEYNSTTTNTTRKCLIYTPPNYDPGTTYPVLYLLHGIGGTHTEWLGGAPNEVLSNLIASGEARPMIAVIPNVRAMQNDTVPSEILGPANIEAFDNFINDLRDNLMPMINKNYPVSTRREECAIAGLSMGGRESIFIGVKMPEVFGYIGAFSPAPGLMDVHMGRPGQLTKAEFTLPGEYADSTYILICNGNQEEMFDKLAKSYHDAFVKNGLSPVYYTVEGGHDFRVWKNGLYHFAKKIFR